MYICDGNRSYIPRIGHIFDTDTHESRKRYIVAIGIY